MLKLSIQKMSLELEKKKIESLPLDKIQTGMAQLSVPAIAAILGATVLSEPVTLRFLAASAVILGGVAMATLAPKPAPRQVTHTGPTARGRSS